MAAGVASERGKNFGSAKIPTLALAGISEVPRQRRRKRAKLIAQITIHTFVARRLERNTLLRGTMAGSTTLR